MTLNVRTLCGAAAITLLLSIPSAALLAQGGSISALAISPDHELIRDGLFGASALAIIPISQGRRSLRLQAERVTGDANRIGEPCSGLIEPGTCPPEPLVDDARMTTAAVGVGFPLLHRAGVGVQFTVDARFGRVAVDTRGRESGRTLAARELIWGGDLGLEGSWSPWARLPLAVEAGVAIGGLRSGLAQNDLDGGSPFNDGFGMRRVRVGVAWRRSDR